MHWLWLLPLAFAIHDGEEVWTVAGWAQSHQMPMMRLADTNGLARWLVELAPVTTRAAAIVASIELLVIVVATWWLAREPRRGWRAAVYAALLGVFVAHALSHVALSTLIFPGYTPGIVTAVSIIPMSGGAIYRRLFECRLIAPAHAALATVVGAMVFVPLFLLALASVRP